MAVAAVLVLGESMAWWNPMAGWIVGIAAETAALLWRFSKKHTAGKAMLWALVFPAVFLLGVFLFENASRKTEIEILLEENPSCKGSFRGKVTAVEKEKNAWQLTLDQASVEADSGGEKIRSATGCGLIVYLDSAGDEIRIGNIVEGKGEMVSFGKATNPGQFDLANYRKAQGIDAMVSAEDVLVVDGKVDWIPQLIFEAREKMKEIIVKLADPSDSGLFAAVLLGDKSGLDENTKSLYETSGIAHIYAVSGTHVSIIGATFYQAIRRASGSFGWAGAVGGAFLLFYAVLVGSPVSAVRAIIMYGCFMAASVRGRMYDQVSALSLASIIILCVEPLQITQCGFQLSFGAVLGIGIVGPSILRKGEPHNAAAQTVAIALGVQLVITPIQLYHFYVYPLYSLILNLFILPAAPALLGSVLAGMVTGFFWDVGGRFLMGIGHLILIYYETMCRISLKLPGAVQTLGSPRAWQLAVYGMFLLLFLLFRERQWQKRKWTMERKKEGRRKKWDRREIFTCVVGLIGFGSSLLFLKRISYEKLFGILSVVMLDVGQGDGFVIRFPDGGVILVDGGSTSESQVGQYCIVPYLQYQGISRVDCAVVSHGDADHVNGIQELAEGNEIAILSYAFPDKAGVEEDFAVLIESAKQSEASIALLSEGWAMEKGGVKITCLYPWSGAKGSDINALSSVLLLEMGEFRMLFTGDIGKEQENFAENIAHSVTVLKVAHHGSRSSTGEEFLQAITPKYAWISCGANNIYGHPHGETINRLQNSGCEIYVTPQCGAVKLETDGKRLRITSERRKERFGLF